MATKLNLRQFNKKNIYNLIYESNGISKGEIASRLGLSLQTVSTNLAELKASGLIREDGTFSSTGGRKPKVIKAMADSHLSVGIDITKNHVGLVLVDLKCNVLASERLRLPFCDREEYYSELSRIVELFIEDSRADRPKILGAGISLPAIIAAGGKSVSFIKILSADDNLYEKLAAAIPFPVLLFNDANSGGAAEIRFRKETHKIVYLSLSNSVGGAIISAGDFYRGDNQRSGEFGHTTLKEGGAPCYCGKRGCADAYCNARLLSDMTAGDLEEFFRRVKRGELDCAAVFREYLSNLSLLVHNLRMCFDCDIVLGGYVGSYMEDYMTDLAELVAARNPFEGSASFIKCSSFKMEASAVGAALYFIDDFLQAID